jgi:hypothetical protein
VITLELPHAGIMPNPQQTGRIWADLLLWLEKNLPEGAPLRASPLFREPWRATLGASLPPGVPLFSDWLP